MSDPRWWNDSRRAWSLWDVMNNLELCEFFDHMRLIEAERCIFGSRFLNGEGGIPLTESEQDRIERHIRMFSIFFERQGLTKCREICSHAHNMVLIAGADVSGCKAHLDTMTLGLRNEFLRINLVAVKSDRVEFCDKDSLFGEQASKAFPSSGRDVSEAGNCLAVEVNTAAVFHLMRAVEFAVRSLARDRDVSFKDKPLEDKEWGQILSALEGKLSDMRQASRQLWVSSEVRDTQIRFYNEVVQELRSFNDAWRRHVSHADVNAFYDRDGALSIFNHVKSFMQKLSSKVSEDSVTAMYWS